jgi:hypothetical protein
MRRTVPKIGFASPATPTLFDFSAMLSQRKDAVPAVVAGRSVTYAEVTGEGGVVAPLLLWSEGRALWLRPFNWSGFLVYL